MYSTRIVVDIIECLNHRSAAVRKKAEIMCELGE
jgi:vesicle coat complex subunit